MPDINIHRHHHLGLQGARKVAVAWAEKAEKKFDMECTYQEGDAEDTLIFSRSGVKGTLLVDAHQFEMKAQLGFLFGAFKDRIEAEIGDQLDALLNAPLSTPPETAAVSAPKAKPNTKKAVAPTKAAVTAKVKKKV
ncbi:MAG: polyhydroxyalkanoic acid system family protein [Burkholderiaceae bacterium]|nr:polyhydroxyalkanoic acid system family protein [Burkholderiaceae bacterium]